MGAKNQAASCAVQGKEKDKDKARDKEKDKEKDRHEDQKDAKKKPRRTFSSGSIGKPWQAMPNLHALKL